MLTETKNTKEIIYFTDYCLLKKHVRKKLLPVYLNECIQMNLWSACVNELYNNVLLKLIMYLLKNYYYHNQIMYYYDEKNSLVSIIVIINSFFNLFVAYEWCDFIFFIFLWEIYGKYMAIKTRLKYFLWLHSSQFHTFRRKFTSVRFSGM